GDADRRRHDGVALLVEPQLPQHLFEDLRARAFIHSLRDKVALALREQAVAPPDVRAGWLADDLRLMEDRERQHPARIDQADEPALSGLAAGECGHRV